jgi:hypothetical protein
MKRKFIKVNLQLDELRLELLSMAIKWDENKKNEVNSSHDRSSTFSLDFGGDKKNIEGQWERHELFEWLCDLLPYCLF